MLLAFVVALVLASAPFQVRAEIFSSQPEPPPATAQTETNTTVATSSVGEKIGKFFSILLGLVGLVSVIFLLKGAVKYVNSQGTESDVEGSKSTMNVAIIAMAITILAFALMRLLTSLLFGN
jgi:TRAP-type C4-dicarboxylate transport system permease small subunit